MSSQLQSTTIDTLPKQFVSSMHILFDIMDEKKTGYVNFSDIENRWEDDGTKGLPKFVLESLKKVTAPNGKLTFERFCAGLKICLLRNQKKRAEGETSRPPSAPTLDDMKVNNWNPSNTNRAQTRAISMPQIASKETKLMFGPPKPPRAAVDRNLDRIERVTDRVGDPEKALDRAEIRTALQNWQLGLMKSDLNRGTADGECNMMIKKAATRSRREPRRHTLQNGIDYNMLKRVKQIEQEKDLLVQGLQAVERARDWYVQQIAAVQDKLKYLGRMGSHMEQWTETQQEKLELQRARVLEVNRHLATLTDSWERGGLPLHMNLAVHPTTQTSHRQTGSTAVARLQQHNHLLSEEVSKKNERIGVLEREKASLIRELLQIRGQTRTASDEAVF